MNTRDLTAPLPAATDEEIAAMLAREAIRELVWRYCRAIDRRDFDALRTLYHDDAIDDHGAAFCGPAQEFIDRLPEIMAPLDVAVHFVANMRIELRGHQAEGEIYSLVCHRMAVDGQAQDILIGGRYLDRYENRGDGWRFLRRKIVLDWNAVRPTQCDWQHPMFDGVPLGRPLGHVSGHVSGHVGDADPSLSFFNWLR